ncbi:MAG: methyl-accepting chemotaxis protein [Candidatus Acinetobacter avistercoris]|uniref:methyl-accepting chemotaxis protein n=1 Tax=Acinetobacter sp. KS-LM10 TaxID=3120518 RepID=UPI001F8D88B1|nr:methyl-accepting chemotaxis protein [Candidatus Acinetobacter avistercoris]
MSYQDNKKKSKDIGSKEKPNLISTIKFKIEQFSQLFGDTDQTKSYLQLGAISLFISFLILIYLFYSVPRSNDLTRSLGELRLLSQTISRQTADAVSTGNKESFTALANSQKKFEENFETVSDIHSNNDDLKNVASIWSKVSKDVDLITAQQNKIVELNKTNSLIATLMPSIQTEYNLLAEDMVNANIPSSQVVVVKNQAFIAERIYRSIGAIVSGQGDTQKTTDEFKQDIETFGNYLNAQLKGNSQLNVSRFQNEEMLETLTAIQSEYNQIVKSASHSILNNSAQIVQVGQASNEISTQSDQLLEGLNALSSSSVWKVIVPGLLLLIALSALIYSVIKLLTFKRKSDQIRVLRLEEENVRNQNAIFRLLDEIGDLAEGDLTAYATVSEDFTGAIADSINIAIDQLKDLVSRINDASQEVAQYTQNTQRITNQLVESSELQAQEISGASAAINEIAYAIDHVSSNAAESAEVAQRSVQIASNGAEVVNRSIEGMDTIREQIQDTSKRIKRLGESTQEIGNFVSLINDIADQTNILALNAAIQASMAGEAGRGFAVVADEVQRLAERSAAATKQIETLVKTIQSDTNEAVISMEQTTSEVVRGANLAKDAGVALDEIQFVSNSLEKLIANISESSKLQSASAGQIANTMNVVQQFTTQNTSAAFDTARSVSELSKMADSLRDSVTNFKLPE